jgi:hypothetical protein
MTKDEGYGLRTFTDTNSREWSILLTGPVFEESEFEFESV